MAICVSCQCQFPACDLSPRGLCMDCEMYLDELEFDDDEDDDDGIIYDDQCP